MRLSWIGGLAAALALLFAIFWTLSFPLPAAAAAREPLMQTEPEPAPAPVTETGTPAAGQNGAQPRSYLGVLRGYVMPNTMYEAWSYPATGQSADLLEEMKAGSLTGGQTGFLPEQFEGFVAWEVERTRQQADVRTIMSPGFTAGEQEVAGFYTEAEDSSVLFQPTMFNLLLRYPEGRFRPYLGLGAGVSRSTISFSEETVTTEGFGFAESGDTTNLAFQVLLGVDYAVSPRLSVGIGYRYFTVTPTFAWANGSQSRYEIGTHSVTFVTKTYR